MTHFQLFDIPKTYEIDLAALTDRYRSRQAEVHPDKFAGSGEAEKLRAIQQTSLLNEAFEILKNPQSRAAYMLRLEGVDLERVAQSDLSPELLMEQIELREELEELPRDDSSIEKLEALRGRIEDRLTSSRQAFAQAFDKNDIELAKSAYFEMQYFSKLELEIENLEEDLLGY